MALGYSGIENLFYGILSFYNPSVSRVADTASAARGAMSLTDS